jgi:uncharacterized protein YabN with tetrapyrrole methylase and pyrophosphatase domain
MDERTRVVVLETAWNFGETDGRNWGVCAARKSWVRAKEKKEGEAAQDFEDEIGNILYTLACFANTHGINLDAALRRSHDKSMGRDKGRF